MPADIDQAVFRLAELLDNLGIKYALLGGAACVVLGSTRETDDIDLVLKIVSGQKADVVNRRLVETFPDDFEWHDPKNIGYKQPALKGFGNLVDVEVFDPEQWPTRPQYLMTSENVVWTDYRHPINGKRIMICTYSPNWLLREKVTAIIERKGLPGGVKEAADALDILFLARICVERETCCLGELDFTVQPDMDAHLKELLQRNLREGEVNRLLGLSIKSQLFGN